MTHIDTIKAGSNGRLVMPPELREWFKEGEELVVIGYDDRLTLAKASTLSEQEREDLEFARRTERAWKEIEAGRCITMEWDDFLKEMKKW